MRSRNELITGWALLLLLDSMYMYFIVFINDPYGDESGLAKLMQAVLFGFLLVFVNLLWLNETLKKH
jgi:hypothetical protein